MSGLAGAGGPSVSSDRNYVLVPESVNKRILRYWVQGPNEGTNEVFMTMTDFGINGSPNNIKRAVGDGEFWVALEKQAQGLRVNESAMVQQSVPLTHFFNMTVAVVQVMNDALYVGSSHTDFVGVYTN
jgi:hypothetical protein